MPQNSTSILCVTYSNTAQDHRFWCLRNLIEISDYFAIMPKLCSKLTTIEILRECRDFKKYLVHSQPY